MAVDCGDREAVAPVKTLVARLLYGRRARAALASAREDLRAFGAERAIAARAATTPGPRRPFALRGVARAIAAELRENNDDGKPCLPRAVALYGEARAHGFEPLLVLGVRRGAPAGAGVEPTTGPPVPGAGSGAVESHAWLELDGKPFLEDPETPSRYETIARLPT